jgi:DNA-binding LytR/AlgR family response regulator
MTIHSPMTFASIARPPASARSLHLAIAALPLAMAIALAVVGAFGSYVSMGLPLRLIHFSGVAVAIGAPAFAVSVAQRRFVFRNAQPLWAAILTAIALAPPGALVVQQSLRLFAPQALPHVSLGELTAQVLLINLIVGTIAWALLRHTDKSKDGTLARDAPRIEATSGSLRAKLPPTLRHAAIIALSAEDHYVRVRTDRGQALILINLADAIAALGSDAGVRIHRSHWIAREVAARLPPRSGRTGVRLDEATILPISRAGRKLLAEMRSERPNCASAL